MEKKARTSYPIHDVIARRWSPRAFNPKKALTKEFILSLLEAARWAPSAYNEQPWRFMLATPDNPQEFADMLDCLVEANQVWARNASLLLIGCIETTFSHNGKPNTTAMFDLGLAVQNLLLECTSKGVFGHVMTGFDPEKARLRYKLPQTVEPIVAIAVGHRATSLDILPEELREAEAALRERKQAYEFTFREVWGNNSGI